MRLKPILRQIGGWLLILAGVAGCILPIIPGIPLLFAGLGLLAYDSPWAARLLQRLKAKYQSTKDQLFNKTPSS